MANAITDEMVQEGYKVAKQVLDGETTLADGVRDLTGRFGMNANSARDIIDNVRHMYHGHSYARKNNAFATRHFLEMLHRDYGVEVLKKATEALRQHLDYYAGIPTGSPQPGQTAILNEFLALVEKERRAVRGPDGLTLSERAVVAEERQRLQLEGVFDPTTLEDARVRTLTSIVRRQGQGTFRTQLLSLYGGRCAVSACDVEAVLEAAHIVPYLGPKTNHPSNGLLLRGDLHTLFDLKLIAVDTATMNVLVAPALNGSSYEQYRGRVLGLPGDDAGKPSKLALDRHRAESGL